MYDSTTPLGRYDRECRIVLDLLMNILSRYFGLSYAKTKNTATAVVISRAVVNRVIVQSIINPFLNAQDFSIAFIYVPGKLSSLLISKLTN